MNTKLLIEKAIEAKNYSISPYSNFKVGAAILTKNGDIITGCNIESASYSLTICAERTAIFKALSDGKKDFSAIAITSDSKDFCPPCGSCRQVILDLCGDIDVIMINSTNEIKITKISQLLPYAFGSETLNQV